MDVEPSQGAHFFHNIAAFEVRYLTVHHDEQPGVDWAWLDRQEPVGETDLVRHVRTAQPVTVKVDGVQPWTEWHSWNSVVPKGRVFGAS